MKLLIVDDSRAVRERLHSLMASLPGVQAEVAADMHQGAVRFRELGPEVVILDIQLPDGSGLDLLKAIKQERPATRVLMLSSHALYRKRCIAEGADYFFNKSADLENLTAIVLRLAEVGV